MTSTVARDETTEATEATAATDAPSEGAVVKPRAAGGAEFDETSRRLLDLLQEAFPLVEQPYEALGTPLGLSESETIERLCEARDAGVIRQICGIYDTKALGYSSALVAMHLPEERLADAAAVINAHPGVSHNYRRNHDLNMWFTVAMPPGHELGAVIERLHVLTGSESTRPMPTLKLFKIGVTLDMTGGRALDARGAPEYTQDRRDGASAFEVDATDIAYIRATQGQLAIEPRPFDRVAEELGWDLERVLAHGRSLAERGFLRRFAGILNHRTAGFRANGMAVWRVPEERIEEFGQFVAGYRNVSHCYQRPTYEDWPYNVFSMLHHPKVAGVEAAAAAIASETGIDDYRVLYSSTEFKKIRLPYYVPEYEEWEARCEAVARDRGLL
jgi:DNA-binding Lrp family transcriptional regulator